MKQYSEAEKVELVLRHYAMKQVKWNYAGSAVMSLDNWIK
jgi:hypothetical protein